MKLRDLTYFNRSDRIVLITFLTVAVLALAVLLLRDGKEEEPQTQTASTTTNVRDGYQKKSLRSSQQYDYYAQPAVAPTLFPFDPNTADSTALLRLGLSPWQVRAIYRYRAKGGIFRHKRDFARLYGLTVKQYRQLEPYIRISSDYQPAGDLFADNRYDADAPRKRDAFRPAAATTADATANSPYQPAIRHKLLPGEQISINAADTTALQRVPGIGSYFARRIAQYRKRLGGYASVSQLREIDDFPEDALPYFQLSGKIKKLPINRLSLQQLKRHPYINYYQAKAICDYRRLHGPLHSLNDLKLLPDFSDADFRRLAPYLDFSEK